jgi:hypothetical protein
MCECEESFALVKISSCNVNISNIAFGNGAKLKYFGTKEINSPINLDNFKFGNSIILIQIFFCLPFS